MNLTFFKRIWFFQKFTNTFAYNIQLSTYASKTTDVMKQIYISVPQCFSTVYISLTSHTAYNALLIGKHAHYTYMFKQLVLCKNLAHVNEHRLFAGLIFLIFADLVPMEW
jgi:hypothetical protein